ncbi:hypothetical protein RJ640_010024 [Escallonia rubra]|uniref:Epidermal patterning factor-like protein n=1 Tax=Escallonia rubra TaxID=112253 RepID=A0AA88QJZ2_9ASTE|nr:hypothetical protein RJ640_010024 [Escallonia rubra]
MASSTDSQNGLRNAAIVMLIFSLSILPTKSGDSGNLEQMRMLLGSRPPKCVNRCLGCKPCMAALVIESNSKNGFKVSATVDESYYLVSWKCRCGHRNFQP